jgi:peroxiredoxin
LLAISVDNQAFAWSTGQTTGAKYQILSDTDHKVIESYGVFSPADHGGIARPATFIIGKDGRIRYVYVGKDPTDRPSEQTIIDEIKKILAG